MSISFISIYFWLVYIELVNKRSHDRAPGKDQLNISLPLSLKMRVQTIARVEKRSVSGQVVKWLEEAVHEYERGEQGNAPAGDACDAPGHCPAPIRLAAESRPRWGVKKQ